MAQLYVRVAGVNVPVGAVIRDVVTTDFQFYDVEPSVDVAALTHDLIVNDTVVMYDDLFTDNAPTVTIV